MDQRRALSCRIRCGCLQGRYECHHIRDESLISCLTGCYFRHSSSSTLIESFTDSGKYVPTRGSMMSPPKPVSWSAPVFTNASNRGIIPFAFNRFSPHTHITFANPTPFLPSINFIRSSLEDGESIRLTARQAEICT